MALDFLTAVVDRTIIPRRHRIRANGRILDIFVRDRKIIAFRRFDEQGNEAFRLVSADAGREVAMPFMWALAGMGSDISENELSVDRLNDEDNEALRAGKALGLSFAELQQRAAQGASPTARTGAANESGADSNVVTFEKAAADRQAERDLTEEPPPADESGEDTVAETAWSNAESPNTEFREQTVVEPASSAIDAPAQELPPTRKITQLVDLLGADTREIAHCTPDGIINRPLGSSGDLSDSDVSALHARLATWHGRMTDTTMAGAKLICAIGPDRDSNVMVCATDGAHSVYAEIRLARMGRLIGQWTQLAEKA